MLDAIGGKLGGLFGQACRNTRWMTPRIPADSRRTAQRQRPQGPGGNRRLAGIGARRRRHSGDKLFDIVRQLDDAPSGRSCAWRGNTSIPTAWPRPTRRSSGRR